VPARERFSIMSGLFLIQDVQEKYKFNITEISIGYESGLAEGIPRAHQFRSYAPQSDGPETTVHQLLSFLFAARNQAARTAKHSTAKNSVVHAFHFQMFRTMGWNMPMGSTT